MNASDYNPYIRNQAGHSTDWQKRGGINHLRNLMKRKIYAILISSRSLSSETRQKVSNFTAVAEKQLFLNATSEDEYKNQETLVQRLQSHFKGMVVCPKGNSYNTCTPMKGPSSGLSHASQMFASSNINFTDYSKETANNTNNYEFSNGRQPHACVGNERTFPSNDFSSFRRSIDPNGFSDFNASGGTSNLNSSSKLIFSHLQQQKRYHVEMDWSKYNGNQSSPVVTTVTTRREPQQSIYGNLMSPPYVRTEASQSFNNFTVQNSCNQYSTLNNLMQYQHQSLGSEQNFQHFKPSYEHGVIAFPAKSGSCFLSKDEPCCQLQGQRTFNQSQLPSTLMNESQQFSSASSARPYGSNGANAHIANKSRACFLSKDEPGCQLLGQKTLNQSQLPSTLESQQFSSASSARPYGSNGDAWAALRHFDECRSDDCRSFESANSMTVYSIVRDHGNLEDILPPTKRLRIEPTFDVSVSNNDDIYERMDSLMVPANTEWLPESQQQPESSLPIYSEATGNNMESSGNAKQDSASFSEIDYEVDGIEAIVFELREAKRKLRGSYPKSDDKVSRDFGGNDSASNSNSSIPTFQRDPSADTNCVQERGGFDQAGEKTTKEVVEPKADLKQATESSNPKIMTVSYGVFGHTLDNETISQGPVVDRVLEESCHESTDLIARNARDTVCRSSFSIQTSQKDPFADIGKEQDKNVIDPTGKSIIDDVKLTLQSDVGSSNSSDHSLQKDPIADIDDIQSRNGFNQSVEDNNTKEVTEPKNDLENGENSSKPTLSGVSFTETFTYDQIREHITSLRQGFGQSTLKEEIGIDDNTCTLCGMDKLFFEPVPIYCLSCGKRIKRNANFYYRRAEEIDTEHCFCTTCFKSSRGESIQFNGASFPKNVFDCKKTDRANEEAWALCDKCQRWQHQICALFNNKRNSEGKFQYVCPNCHSMEIEEGIPTPIGTAIFGAKDLPRTKLSDHIEKRLFSRLEREREQKAKVEGKNVDEISGAENLTVRVVPSVEKQLKVKKEFLDILSGENYPPEFPYTSKVILLFQNIEGVDVCIYVIFVQEFGSECAHPNHRCVYISYLDSVKYFRPERHTVTGEALRTFVYHEILIGYLEFCKKRGFGKCYIWACPPPKGEDYVLYCHPQSQKTPKNDKLRHWYHSVLRKASQEDIVVGLTNVYDHFFVTAQKRYSKVTAARLPYFDGDFWSGAAMDEIKRIEQESKGECGEKLKQVLTKRAIKSMGHTKPSKDVLVMQKLGQTILPVKEDFIIVQLQYACTLCHEVILSGKRWFCTECKKYQQCERCHTSGTHTSISGEKHTLYQVAVNDIPGDTKENDIVQGNDLFQNRLDFLNFFQQNQLQFDTLRRAKHSSMMLLYHLKTSALHHNVDSKCSICRKDNVSQPCWQCDLCPQLSICSTCYEEKGANCHEHKLRRCSSTAHCLSENQGLKQKTTMRQELLKVLGHASRCNSTISQPCSYPNCLLIKKLFSHASKCTVKARGGCQHCKKAWTVLSLHSKNCKDSECRIPRCNDMKNYAEWLTKQHESRRRAAVLGSSAREIAMEVAPQR